MPNTKEVYEAIKSARAITILSHVNPDADTLGTALGIYALLSTDKHKRVEVVNASKGLPHYLDFLPNYKKVKHKIEYDGSLIIACDCATIERLGFDVSGHDIINIDHHKSNTNFGKYNIVVEDYASASQVAFLFFSGYCNISKESAICFYAALLSDTHFFTTDTVDKEVFSVVQALIELDVNPAEVAYHFKTRKSLSALRLLAKALDTLTLHNEAKVATLYVSQEVIKQTGASVFDMEGVVDYAISLATVEVGICVMELSSGLRVSLRSKKADVLQLAQAFGGGGHKYAAGFSMNQYSLQESMDIILMKIEKLSVLS